MVDTPDASLPEVTIYEGELPKLGIAVDVFAESPHQVIFRARDFGFFIHINSPLWNASEDQDFSTSEMTRALDESEEPALYVSLIPEAKMDMGDFVKVVNTVVRGEGAPLHHTNLKEFVVASKSSMYRLAAKGLRHPVFGEVPIQIFDAIEEALAYAIEESMK